MKSIKCYYLIIAILFFSNNLVSKTVFINQNNTWDIDLSDCKFYILSFKIKKKHPIGCFFMKLMNI